MTSLQWEIWQLWTCSLFFIILALINVISVFMVHFSRLILLSAYLRPNVYLCHFVKFLCNVPKMKLFKSFWLKWSACVLVNSSEGRHNLNRSEGGQNHFNCTCVLYISLMIFICSYVPWDICLFMCVWRYSYISCCEHEGYQILLSRNCRVYSFLLENLQQMCKCLTFVYEIRLRYWPERPKNLWISFL